MIRQKLRIMVIDAQNLSFVKNLPQAGYIFFSIYKNIPQTGYIFFSI
jgi:hypothetical protein